MFSYKYLKDSVFVTDTQSYYIQTKLVNYYYFHV